MNVAIKEALLQKGLTQKELAEKMGVSPATLSRSLNGRVTGAMLDRIATALEIDKKALLGDSILTAKYEGTLHLGDKEVACAVLNNNLRVLTVVAVFSVFDRPRRGQASDRAEAMPPFLDANNLQPYIDEELSSKLTPVPYIALDGSIRQGYDARLLRSICKVYIDANRDDVLTMSQRRFVATSECVLYALADTGIIALVDEATGYDKIKTRARNELQLFFAKALQEQAGKWVKTFPDEFFERIYEMRHWTWTGVSKHPGVMGMYINDIIYDRLAPSLLEELRKLNPSVNGNRKHKHHQHFTEDYGHPELQKRIEGVLAIARISGNDWTRFMHNVDRAYPRRYQQMSFEEFYEEDL